MKLIETQVREAIANGTIGERVWFYANYHCNLACRYCLTSSSPSVPRRELDATVMLALANDAVRRMVDEKLRVERTCERNQSRAEISAKARASAAASPGVSGGMRRVFAMPDNGALASIAIARRATHGDFTYLF